MTSDLRATITQTFEYLMTNSIAIPSELLIQARLKGIRVGAKAAGDMSGINAAYHDAITKALTIYFEGGSVTGPKNQFKQAATIAFGDAFDLGYEDGGGELPFTGDALDWFNARLEQEFGNIDALFVQAKELRKDDEFDFFAWITARADGYTSALASIYNAAVMFAKGNQMLRWHLGNTEKHCATCIKLANGPAHRASWFIARDYIPRKPGAAMECNGYNCDCSLTDKEGREVTI